MRRRGTRQLLSMLVASAAFLAGCGGGSEDGSGDASGDLGREVFVSVATPACGSCHTLSDAGATGTVGPDLDELQPSRDQVEQAVRDGPGVMPSFADQLSDEQIGAVADYVAGAAAG